MCYVIFCLRSCRFAVLCFVSALNCRFDVFGVACVCLVLYNFVFSFVGVGIIHAFVFLVYFMCCLFG